MGAPDFFIGLWGGGVPSFRHSGKSDKNQCRGAKYGRFGC